MSDLRKMSIGQIVDFCVEYNIRHKEAAAKETKAKEESGTKYRYATKEEMKAYFG